MPPTTDNVKDSKKHNCNEVIQYTWNNAPMLYIMEYLNESDHCRALCVLNTRDRTQIPTLYI